MERVTFEHFPENKSLSEYERRNYKALEIETEDNFPCILDKVQNFEVILDIRRKGDDSDWDVIHWETPYT